ncbi:MAG: sodium:solute symporter family protein [Armatimonadota bacterium]
MINLSTIDIVIIVVYLAIVVSLGLVMKRRAAKNIGSYFLGGRELPWWALAMSGSSSYFDITGTMWIVSLFVMIGLKGMWVQWVWGFIIPAFYLAFMGKWIRRSGVMTGSEWMETRFGSGKAGEAARASYTLYAVLTITAFLAYGATGMGKFGSVYLPYSEHVCAALIIGITGAYVIAGGFRGVVLVEIFQTIVLSIGAIMIAYIGYMRVTPDLLASKVSADWGSLIPKWNLLDLNSVEYKMFGALLIIWVMKGLLLSLSGPEQLYDFQRFLAAKNPRDASKLGALWGAIHTVRWPMAMALAVLGIVGLTGTTTTDPEKVLPNVIQHMLQPGLRGLVIAALLSGFLATFNSTVNGGASYMVKDIYHKYINPNASEQKLIYASYISSALLIVMGMFIGFFAQSINQMFTWIMGTLGAGVLMPNVLRWYWWRINGWGYAAGAVSGMVLSLIQAFVPYLSKLPLYVTFPIILIAVLIITVIVTLKTAPTEDAVLRKFYTEVRPAGFWGPVARGLNSAELTERINASTKRDFGNVLLAIPWIAAMYMCPVYVVLHRFSEAAISGGMVAALTIALYFTWYKHLEND